MNPNCLSYLNHFYQASSLKEDNLIGTDQSIDLNDWDIVPGVFNRFMKQVKMKPIQCDNTERGY